MCVDWLLLVVWVKGREFGNQISDGPVAGAPKRLSRFGHSPTPFHHLPQTMTNELVIAIDVDSAYTCVA